MRVSFRLSRRCGYCTAANPSIWLQRADWIFVSLLCRATAIVVRSKSRNVQQYASAGLNFGAFYDRSPIIAYDGAEHPAYTMSSYTPSTVPGCRTPHFWCEDGTSLYDAMGPEFTLLRFDPATDVAALEAAARVRGVPLRVLNVKKIAAVGFDSSGFDGSAFDGSGLVLSRPDQHVAWRGDRLPADPLSLIDRVRGAANQRGRLSLRSRRSIPSRKPADAERSGP
jgi:hypothetical protein